MTENSLIEKTNTLIEDCCKSMKEKMTAAIRSGVMDVSGAEDNWILPKTLICALLKEEYFQFELSSFMVKDFKKKVEEIYASI